MSSFHRDWLVDDPVATMVLVHGVCEHSGRYEHVGAWLNEHRVSVYSGDLPGFGQSPGLSGHIWAFTDYLTAVDE